MNAPAAVDARFWDRLAPKYAKKPVPDEQAYRRTLERVRAHLTTDARVLEVGCGTGTTALKLGPYAKEFVASDLSGQMISIACEKARVAGSENVRFKTGTLDDVTLGLESFDVVLAFNLLHLLADVPAAIQRVGELVKPRGLFISKTPCVGEDGLLIRGIIPLLRVLGKAPFVNYVKKDSLCASIADAGFEIIETGLYPAKSHSLFVVGRKT